jgi:hypothetical protein
MMYTINGKTYIQKPLVLGQIQPLITLLEGKTFDDVSPLALISELGETLPRCMAIILIPEGSSVRDRDLDALAAELAECMDMETAMLVASDFFLCNPLFSLLRQLRELVRVMWEQSRKIRESNGS